MRVVLHVIRHVLSWASVHPRHFAVLLWHMYKPLLLFILVLRAQSECMFIQDHNSTQFPSRQFFYRVNVIFSLSFSLWRVLLLRKKKQTNLYSIINNQVTLFTKIFMGIWIDRSNFAYMLRDFVHKIQNRSTKCEPKCLYQQQHKKNNISERIKSHHGAL